MTAALTVWGEPGASSLVLREDLERYHLTVQWDPDDMWRGTCVGLPSGRQVAVDQYVGDNFRHPRQFHPEYAMAVELLIANAVMAAKERGFRVAAVELGVWPYRTLTSMSKRIRKIGLAQPMLLHDGRTLTRVGLMWIDHEGEGVMIVPWANGDQLIRLKDDRGHYVVPVDERTGDAANRSVQADSWQRVHEYPALSYDAAMPWDDVPLLGSADEMVVQEPCEHCLFLFPLGSLRRDAKAQKRVCPPCKEELARLREQARLQGWDFDKGTPIKRPMVFNVAVKSCTHRWGMQMAGTSNSALPPEKRAAEGMKVRYECILCGEPAPKPN